jgi:hypothetical protein
MPRPLTPLNDTAIAEYEKRIQEVVEKGDKREIKEAKRLFLVYIKKRGYTITAFKERSIYQYFTDRENPKRIEVLKQELQELKNENKHIKEYMIKNASRHVKNEHIDYFITLVNDYFSNSLDNEKNKKLVERYIKIYKSEGEYFGEQWELERIIKLKEKELNRLIDKKYKMREYRNKKKAVEEAETGIQFETKKEHNLTIDIGLLKDEILTKEKELLNDYREETYKLKSDYQLTAKELLKAYKRGLASIKKMEQTLNQKIKKLEALKESRMYLMNEKQKTKT